jgi:hypothetical protein
LVTIRQGEEALDASLRVVPCRMTSVARTLMMSSLKFWPASRRRIRSSFALGRPHLFGTRNRPLRRLDARHHLRAGIFPAPAVFLDLFFMI